MHTAAEGDAPPTGLFIANDSDIKRCHMLVHQALGRIGSPNMMVTNLDATMIPTLKTQKPGAAKGVTTSLQYDRILTDVPCTGDGTMRKNMLIWRHWTTGNAVGLHPFVIDCSEALNFLREQFRGQTADSNSESSCSNAQTWRSHGVFNLLSQPNRERSCRQRDTGSLPRYAKPACR